MTTNEKLLAFRAIMKKKKIDAYLITSSDYHQSEYCADFFRSRAYISGFTGSAGTLVITLSEAVLWTDGRYFIQCEKELQGSEIKLFKMGMPETLSLSEYLYASIPEQGVLGLDGTCISAKEGISLEKEFSKKKIRIKYTEDIVASIWKNRPALPNDFVFLLEEKYSGENTDSKLARIREKMKEYDASIHLLTSLDDIAWTLNLRGHDISYSPLFLSFLVIFEDSAILYIQREKLPEKIKELLSKSNVSIRGYRDIYNDMKELAVTERVLFDPAKINYTLYKKLPAKVTKIQQLNPSMKMKALKNATEIQNLKEAHLHDAVACTKFMYWLKTRVEDMNITELVATQKLESLRQKHTSYLEPSFSPICAYKEHAAMMHYNSSEETDVRIESGSFLLVDTGGHYWEGSTDVTRTYAIGNVSDELKYQFTAVLKSMIRLADTTFLHGCRGFHLDSIARAPIWKLYRDYKCGTGHGVGYLLSVHEGPASFRWQSTNDEAHNAILENGMVITDEPGIYVEGSHGIRIENQLLIQEGMLNGDGQFMYFEPLTLVPIDLDAIEPEFLTWEEKEYLNSYHQLVYDKLSSHLTTDERQWLKNYTRVI